MSIDLGHVDVLGVDASGQPGQRRFCLFARSRRGSALMWMEKEQLNRLSLTLDQALAQLSEGQVLRTEAQVGSRPAPTGIPTTFPRSPEYDFRTAQMGLAYDERDEMFAFTVAPVEILMEQGQEEPQVLVHEEEAISLLFTQKQAQDLSNSIAILVSGGRPVCPFCHTPLDGGPHACVKQNGHHEIVQIVAEEDEEE